MLDKLDQNVYIWAQIGLYEALTNSPEYAILTKLAQYAIQLDITWEFV